MPIWMWILPFVLACIAVGTVFVIWTRRDDWERSQRLWMTFLLLQAAIGVVIFGGYDEALGVPQWGQIALLGAMGLFLILGGYYLWEHWKQNLSKPDDAVES